MRWLAATLVLTSIVATAAEMPIGLRMHKAAAAYQAKKYDVVVQLLNPYTDQLPNSGLLLLSSTYSRTGQYREEVRVLQILVAQNDKSYEALMLLGQGYLKLSMMVRDPEAQKSIEVQAIQTFRACLKLRPNYKPAYDTLLAILMEQTDNSDSRELLVDGIEHYGQRPELISELCRIDSTDGYVVQAIKSCEEAVKASPNFPDSYVYLAQSLYDETENEKAEQQLVAAAKRFPASEFVQWATGTVFAKRKNYPVSVRYFGQAVKDDPTSFRSHYSYAQSLYEIGQEAQALPEYYKACLMNSREVLDPFFAAGARLRQKGNTRLGQKYKEMAVSCHR